MDAADLVVINTCAIREAAEAKVIGRQGELAKLKAANASMRVVMTGCAVREMDRERLDRRFPAVDLFLRPDEEPELVDRLGLASAQGPVGLLGGPPGERHDRRDDRRGPNSRRRRRPPRRHARQPPSPAARCTAQSAVSAWLPIIYGCDKTCTYCIVPFSRGPERSRPFDEIVDEARVDRGAGVPRGHAARPERQLVRPRPGPGGEIRARPDRALGGPPAGPGEPPGPRGAHPRDRRPPNRRRGPGDPAPPVHHVAPVGPVGSLDRCDGRLPLGVRGAAPAGPVRR